MDEHVQKEKESYPRCGLGFWLILILLVSGLVYQSVVFVRLHIVEINKEFKRLFYGWKECDDYNNINVTIYIRPHKTTSLIEPNDVCSNTTKHVQNKLLFLVFVLSAINHFDIRKQIRSTWGNYNNYRMTCKLLTELRVMYTLKDYPYIDNYGEVDMKALKVLNERDNNQYFLTYKVPLFRVVFVLGKPGDNDNWSQKYIDKEAAEYNDIIQEDFLDTYTNLTLKTLMMLKWAINNCGDSVRYIMKSDDDAFINMHLMVKKLLDRAEEFDDDTNLIEEERALFGLFKGEDKSGPNRDGKAKHFVPRCYYPDDTPLPAYLAGNCGYVMSMPVAKALYKASWDTPYMNLEDIYVTGLLPRRSEPRLRLEPDASFMEGFRTMYTALRTCFFLERCSIGSIDVPKMWAMQKRMLKIEELQQCYLKINRKMT